MDKTEYKRIMEYLDEGKIKELKKYLNNRMNLKELKNAKKVIMDLIKSDYINIYPSYYQKMNHDGKVRKVYNGIIEETRRGIAIFHGNSNLFEIYNKEILDSSLSEMLEYNREYYDQNHNIKREDMLNEIQLCLNALNKKHKKKVVFHDIIDDGRYVEVFDRYEEVSAIIPNKYYKIAHQLIGEETEEYLDSKGTGVYLKNSNGRALIMRIDNKTK